MLVCVLTVSFCHPAYASSSNNWTFHGQNAYNNASKNVQKEGKRIEEFAKKSRNVLEQVQKAAEEMQKSNGNNKTPQK